MEASVTPLVTLPGGAAGERSEARGGGTRKRPHALRIAAAREKTDAAVRRGYLAGPAAGADAAACSSCSRSACRLNGFVRNPAGRGSLKRSYVSFSE